MATSEKKYSYYGSRQRTLNVSLTRDRPILVFQGRYRFLVVSETEIWNQYAFTVKI